MTPTEIKYLIILLILLLRIFINTDTGPDGPDYVN